MEGGELQNLRRRYSLKWVLEKEENGGERRRQNIGKGGEKVIERTEENTKDTNEGEGTRCVLCLQSITDKVCVMRKLI